MRAKKEGKIINISSISGDIASATTGIYSATKAAVTLMSDALSKELEEFNIHVTTIAPSGVRTKFLDSSMKRPKKEIKEYTKVQEAILNYEKLNNNQKGNPKLVSSVIMDVIKSNNPPKKLYLGTYAYNAISDKYKKDLEEAYNNKNISLSIDDR